MTYEEVVSQLQKQGYRLTAARRHVIAALCSHPQFLGAYDIHHVLELNGIHIGVSSVYRVLELLETMALLQREEFGSGSERFRLRAGHTHHHAHQLVCSRCGRTEEFAGCPLQSWAQNLESQSGYRIQEHWLRFFGLCPHCQTNTPALKQPTADANPHEGADNRTQVPEPEN